MDRNREDEIGMGRRRRGVDGATRRSNGSIVWMVLRSDIRSLELRAGGDGDGSSER